MFADYHAQAEAFIAAGQLDDALLSYEAALLDPHLQQYRAQRAAVGRRLGEMQLQRLPQMSDPQAIRTRLERTVALLRTCAPDPTRPQAGDILSLLIRLHCEGFERFGEQRHLLAANLLIDSLAGHRPQDRSRQAALEALRRRIATARATHGAL